MVSDVNKKTFRDTGSAYEAKIAGEILIPPNGRESRDINGIRVVNDL